MFVLLPREKKEVRSLAASGVIHVVKTNWLEDCDRQKKEIPVHQRHVAYDLLLPKGCQIFSEVNHLVFCLCIFILNSCSRRMSFVFRFSYHINISFCSGLLN